MFYDEISMYEPILYMYQENNVIYWKIERIINIEFRSDFFFIPVLCPKIHAKNVRRNNDIKL